MSKQSDTTAHNLAAIDEMLERQDIAAVTGAVCPKCGYGVNPTILARYGCCLSCDWREYSAGRR